MGVSTFTRPLGINDEVTEAGDFDLFALLQAALKYVKSGLDDIGRILLGKADLLIDSSNNLCLRHL